MTEAAVSTDFAALWASVEAAPKDDAPKLVLADWLQERGERPDLERGLRWCVANGKWPRDAGVNKGTYLKRYWWVGPKEDGPRRYQLPPNIDHALMESGAVSWGDDALLPLVERTGGILAQVERDG